MFKKNDRTFQNMSLFKGKEISKKQPLTDILQNRCY